MQMLGHIRLQVASDLLKTDGAKVKPKPFSESCCHSDTCILKCNNGWDR